MLFLQASGLGVVNRTESTQCLFENGTTRDSLLKKVSNATVQQVLGSNHELDALPNTLVISVSPYPW